METLNRGIACKQDEAAPLVSEEMYRAVVESSRDAMLILDDQFRIIFVNGTACRVSGFSRQDFLGHNFMDFLPGEHRAAIVERYQKRQQGENPPSEYDISYLMKSGEFRHAALKTRVFRNSAGKVWTICQMSDVTDLRRTQKALQKSEERLKSVTSLIWQIVHTFPALLRKTEVFSSEWRSSPLFIR